MQHRSTLRLWWRRKVFSLRQRSSNVSICLLIIFIFLYFFVPNPFSSYYKSLPIDQNVEWNSIEQLLERKQNILDDDRRLPKIKVVKHGKNQTISSTSPILIVLYTTVFHQKKFCSLAADQIFGQTCPMKDRCQWSCDETRLAEADAIIFHAFDILYYRLKLPDRSEAKPNAVWILWSDEPPSIIDYRPLNLYRFNWTISYKFDSEVSIGSYGLFSKREHSWSDEEFQLWIHRQFVQRQKGTLWFVSNCKSRKRLNIYSKLKTSSNLINEGYGRCVDYYPLHWCGAYSPCEHAYMSDFKYYLSFESNTCRDYITEKFYKAFYYNLIPIAYGPKKNNYQPLAPTNSFIHIEDFNDNIEHLAELLENIHQNETLFSTYHQWRKEYEVIIDGKALERIRMCELCYRLTRLQQGEQIYYENLDKFYNDQCKDIYSV